MKAIFAFNNFRDSIFCKTEGSISIWLFKFTSYTESYFSSGFRRFGIFRVHNCQNIETLAGKNLTSDVKKLLTGFSFIIFIVGRVSLNNTYLIFCRNNWQTVLRKRIIKLF